MFNKLMSIALEDMAEHAETVVEVQVDDRAEAAVMEVCAEMDANDANIATGTAVADTLGEMVEPLEAAVADGGMDENQAKILEAAVEHLCASIDLPKTMRKVPAFESFATPAGRVASTKIALESIKEVIAKIVAAIKAAYAKVVGYLKSFYAALVTYWEGLNRRSASLKKLLEAKKNKELPADAEIKSPSFAKALCVGGKLVEPSEFVKKFEAFAADSSAGVKHFKAHSAKIEAQLLVATSSIGAQDFDQNIDAAIQLVADGLYAAKVVSEKDGKTTKERKLLLGASSMYSLADSKPTIKTKVTFTEDRASSVTQEMVDLLKKETVKPLSYANAEALLSKITAYTGKAGLSGLAEAAAAMEADVKAQLKNAEKAKAEDTKNLSKVVAAAGQFTAYASRMNNLIYKYELRTLKATLDYCSASVSLME